MIPIEKRMNALTANECAKFIIQSGIREIRYVDDDDPNSDSSRASRILFEVSGVKMTKITPGVSSIRIDFGSPCSNDDDDDVDASSASGPKRDVGEMEKYLGLLRREASMDPFEYEVTRRMDYLSWDEYFMGVAFLSGHRSKDPMTQVGACLVDADKCIVGIGYNGFPRGCSDDVLPWARSAPDELHKKYPYGELERVPSVILCPLPPVCTPCRLNCYIPR
jgi:deoxycytidylate deaminase